MNTLMCKIFGHAPVITKKRVYCKRCKKNGFMQPINRKHGQIVEYWV